jgi:hypothetical protein
MKSSSFLVLIAAAVGFLALSAPNSEHRTPTARADDKPDATAAKIKQLEDKVAALEANQEKLLKQLHDLQFPELRRRHAREIQVLKHSVDVHKAQYNRIKAFHDAKVIGGEHVFLQEAAYDLALARAQLAWAETRINDAVRHAAEAAVHAQERMRELNNIWQSGVAKVGQYAVSASFGKAFSARDQAHLGLIRAVAVAEEVKVDLSDLKVDVGRSTEIDVKSLLKNLESLRAGPPLQKGPPPSPPEEPSKKK